MKALLLMIPALAATAWAAAPDSGERARIVAEREAVVQRFAAEERACSERFVVTACIDDVRLRRRDALAPLRDREMRLLDQERRQRTAERQVSLAAKQRAAAERGPSPPLPPELRLRPARTASAPTARAAPHEADERARSAAAAERAQAGLKRQAEARAEQARVTQRLVEREAKGKPVQPLPVPASAARR